MISGLKIDKLFNRFDYDIELHKNRITILTGPNGFGKSTILKIISALSSSNFLFFYKLAFESIYIEFDDGENICIQKENIGSNSKKSRLIIDGKELPNLYFESNFVKAPWIHRVSPTEWLDFKVHRIINRDEIISNIVNDIDDIKKLSEYIEIPKGKSKQYAEALAKLKIISEKCGNVRLISEQRLIRKEFDEDHDEKIVDVISQLPEKMKSRISKISADYSKAANELDSTYPQRLLATKIGLTDEQEFQKKLQDANEKFKKLSTYDLADITLIKPTAYEEEFSKALKIYFEDFEKKYKVFSNFIDRLDLYTDIINARLNFKSIRITRDEGLIIVDDNDSSKHLKLEQLSSGEKQEIVLFYELIFETEKQLLLLIDEPEISLHIVWQKMFMQDLDRVVNLGNLKVIIATHAPQIINNRWDLQIDLGELYGG